MYYSIFRKILISIENIAAVLSSQIDIYFPVTYPISQRSAAPSTIREACGSPRREPASKTPNDIDLVEQPFIRLIARVH